MTEEYKKMLKVIEEMSDELALKEYIESDNGERFYTTFPHEVFDDVYYEPDSFDIEYINQLYCDFGKPNYIEYLGEGDFEIEKSYSIWVSFYKDKSDNYYYSNHSSDRYYPICKTECQPFLIKNKIDNF